ncbi:MAG: bifunctional diaminohydroxyphosphoribosylaminopyrimidine deaminase/5-amino-6-(5-phosphoribosylamino)uracil reductase RibD [Nitriliruptorales bacterium]|nr:bifunctional diaminohydroxyphosphoribosylaminopyrimidine deaminase/5-amino-6-(5-phosphoribosylamino)uracil reductase RibD [Nitriliruptorales bacterium]
MTTEPDRDVTLMARALALAERGRGTVAPNPMVGCVIAHGTEVVGAGWHEAPGGPHAEVGALRAAGDRAEDATAYVTLEPCDHHGRTPPCSGALLAAGVRRVVYGLDDPHPVARGGAATLRAAGIDVDAGVLAPFVASQNRRFLVNVTDERPLVTLKLAQTGAGSLQSDDGRWITGAPARRHVHRLRSRADAVLVGVGTAMADDPRLDVRHVTPGPRQPRPVVADSSGRLPLDATVVRPDAIVVTTGRSAESWRSRLADAGVEVVLAPADVEGRVDLAAALRLLYDTGVTAVLAEPGAILAGALVRHDLVDRLVLHVAGDGRTLDPAPCTQRSGGRSWRPVMARPVGADREFVFVPEETA